MPFILRTRLSPLHFAFLYLAVFILAETVIAMGYPPIGLMMHAGSLCLLLVHTSFTWDSPHHRFIMILLFAPLMRMIGLVQPLVSLPSLYGLALTVSLMLLAALLVIRTLGLTWQSIGLTVQKPSVQLLVIPTGLLFGYIQYQILEPQLPVPALTWLHVLIYAPILLVSTGLLTELIFRGIMQSTAFELLGRFGIFYIAILFAILSIGPDSFYTSLPAIGLALVMGLFFGAIANRTGSIIGVALSHGLTNVVLFLVMPFLVAAGSGASQVAFGADIASTPLAISNAASRMAADSASLGIEQGIMMGTTDLLQQEAVALRSNAQAVTATPITLPTIAAASRVANTAIMSPALTGTVTVTVGITATLSDPEALTFTPESTASPSEDPTSTPLPAASVATTATVPIQQEPTVAKGSVGATLASTAILTPTATLVLTETALSTATLVPTAMPLPTVIVSPTATLLPTAMPLPTVIVSPTATLLPTAMPLPTVIISPTATLLPTTVLVLTETPLPTATALPTAIPLPTLEVIEPADGAVSQSLITFRWGNQWTLREGQRLKLVFWQEGGDPQEEDISITVPTGQQKVTADLKQLDLIFRDKFGPGTYHWGLILVRVEPTYERLMYLGSGNTFIFE